MANLTPETATAREAAWVAYGNIQNTFHPEVRACDGAADYFLKRAMEFLRPHAEWTE